MEDIPKVEAKRVTKSAIHLQGRFNVGDKVWVLNTDHSKLQPGKVGPAVVVVVHHKNTYIVKDLIKNTTEEPIICNTAACVPAKLAKQSASRLPATAKKLENYVASVPETLPKNTPTTEVAAAPPAPSGPPISAATDPL